MGNQSRLKSLLCNTFLHFHTVVVIYPNRFKVTCQQYLKLMNRISGLNLSGKIITEICLYQDFYKAWKIWTINNGFKFKMSIIFPVHIHVLEDYVQKSCSCITGNKWILQPLKFWEIHAQYLTTALQTYTIFIMMFRAKSLKVTFQLSLQNFIFVFFIETCMRANNTHRT
jgi:hypothetical protein